MESMRSEGACRLTGAAAAAALIALGIAGGVGAQGTDDLYEVTVKMEVPGMPMPMPAITQKSCVKRGASEADAIPHQDNCTVTNARRTGNKVSFVMVCTGRDAMTGDGEITYAGDGYSGRVRYKAKMEGQDMDMMQSISGRRLGNCTAP